ncbi:hypothetical protein GCK32_014745 [Trichostrongylus colubriformis]|uniref:Uncharacterized protein n=1 Tax=Trichostrongylus colubriformis TaxID=6319 RepID=A0AAN8FN92_TRICO
MMYEVEQAEVAMAAGENRAPANIRMVFEERTERGLARRQFDLPTANEVAVIYVAQTEAAPRTAAYYAAPDPTPAFPPISSFYPTPAPTQSFSPATSHHPTLSSTQTFSVASLYAASDPAQMCPPVFSYYAATEPAQASRLHLYILLYRIPLMDLVPRI